ncbi:MAG TPA: 23S rRNA (adenine(2503)-C(2))-methyltransferase RlmN [Bacilli bacterium]|nr:23S rRNA (adenine(2503)-C(2))-methyltransferase RlmN [Bacilli bacterium]
MGNIFNYTQEDLERWLLDNSEKKYRGRQLFDWLYVKRVNTFANMSNLSKDLISKLENSFSISDISLIKKEEDEGVIKYLFKLEDEEFIESVVMFHDYGISLCVSSQVGCNMGCVFCNSGTLKKVRNLSPSEIILQILKVEKDIKKRISHIVIMGIGEPFDNYDNICNFIKIINNPFGLNIGSRHITVSTCGIVPKILEFSDFKYQVNLAISLHAPNDVLRNGLMPISKVYDLKSLIDAVKKYIKVTNRRVTFEYIMLDGVNDTKECALELAKLIRGMNAYVNLIPYNETVNLTYKRSNDLKINKFYDILKKEGINVTIRKEFGKKISAACGQLRSNKE